MAYYTKIEVFGFMKEVLERGKKGEIRIMVDPEEAARKLGADEDLVAMFWVQPNNVEGSSNLKMGMDGKVFVKIDFDLYSDDRYAIDCYQAGKEGLTYAASKGLGVVVMEPLRGGKLTDQIPVEVQTIWESAEKKRTPAEWALRWVWNHPEVSTALSGVSTMGQIMENVRVANEGKPNSLSDKELSIIGQVKEAYRRMLKIDCTGCTYCMPCETGVNIPLNFSLYNDLFMFKDAGINLLLYNEMLSPEQRASACTECGKCEEKCPYELPIIEKLSAAHEMLK